MISIHALTFRRTTKLFYFYPRPPRGGRLSGVGSYCFTTAFLSTPSARRATMDDFYIICSDKRFLSTPSARRATMDKLASAETASNFYPRPPRGGRPIKFTEASSPDQFLSTPSARRATSAPAWRCSPHSHFYPRPPRGGRQPGNLCTGYGGGHFYPRPPRGGRPSPTMTRLICCRFLSTPSARRATRSGRCCDLAV